MAHKTWDFTLNNYTEENIKTLEKFATDVNRMVVGKEVGEKGTPHLQGRITFKQSRRLRPCKKLLPRAHWEPTKCKADWLYVMKGDVIIDVNNGNPGKRSDLELISP